MKFEEGFGRLCLHGTLPPLKALPIKPAETVVVAPVLHTLSLPTVTGLVGGCSSLRMVTKDDDCCRLEIGVECLRPPL